MIASTPQPPYYAVIFTSLRTTADSGYLEMSAAMLDEVHKQPGFLGFESARQEIGITVSYWKDLESIKAWREHAQHSIARQRGREVWYKSFRVRICKVEREYGMED